MVIIQYDILRYHGKIIQNVLILPWYMSRQSWNKLIIKYLEKCSSDFAKWLNQGGIITYLRQIFFYSVAVVSGVLK